VRKAKAQETCAPVIDANQAPRLSTIRTRLPVRAAPSYDRTFPIRAPADDLPSAPGTAARERSRPDGVGESPLLLVLLAVLAFAVVGGWKD
jgi:hypothetical protein